MTASLARSTKTPQWEGLSWKGNETVITQNAPVLITIGVVLYARLEDMLLKSTTRHIRIFSAEIENEQLVPSEDKLTLDVDPDNELNWNDSALEAVYRKFDELVEASAGEELTDYNLRRIGSDLEHFVRSLLQNGTLTYNLNSRVRNFSMGLPQVDADMTV